MTVDRARLGETAQAMVAAGKGILAADESNATMTKRLEAVGVESTAESRRFFRGLMFTAQGAADYISGVIMYDETIRQTTADGMPFPEFLAREGILPGIKVDTGAKPLAGFPEETVTEGLDGLRDRLRDYRELGGRFAKWRAVVRIDSGLPTGGCVEAKRARARTLCRAVPRGRHRADRRARGPDGG